MNLRKLYEKQSIAPLELDVIANKKVHHIYIDNFGRSEYYSVGNRHWSGC